MLYGTSKCPLWKRLLQPKPLRTAPFSQLLLKSTEWCFRNKWNRQQRGFFAPSIVITFFLLIQQITTLHFYSGYEILFINFISTLLLSFPLMCCTCRGLSPGAVLLPSREADWFFCFVLRQYHRWMSDQPLINQYVFMPFETYSVTPCTATLLMCSLFNTAFAQTDGQ